MSEVLVKQRKRRFSGTLDDKIKQVIKNTNEFLEKVRVTLAKNMQFETINRLKLNNVRKKVSELCDVSFHSVYKVTQEDDKENQSISPAIKMRKPRKPKYECDQFIVSMIRRITQDFYANKHFPTLTLLWKKCLENPDFPRISRSLFHVWLIKHCKFKYRRINKKPVYLERVDIVVQRRTYLTKIKEFRRNNYKIFYSDETWVTPDQTRKKCWQMLLNDSEKRALKDVFNGQLLHDMDGYAGGFLVKSGNGRIILNHIGSEDGFLEGGDDLFISKKDTRDYHGNMNFERYITWFKKILSLVPDKSVLVLDQAPYHKKRVEGTIMPTMAWLKGDIIAWLEKQHVELPGNASTFQVFTKPQLIQLSKQKPVKPKYIVEDLAEKCGKEVKVLWLPVAHCEFNPIELVWANVKGFVATNNNGKNLNDMLSLTRQALVSIPDDLWKNCIRHAMKYEDTMWERDHIIDNVIDGTISSVVIPLHDNDTSSSDESESEDDSSSSSDSLNIFDSD